MSPRKPAQVHTNVKPEPTTEWILISKLIFDETVNTRPIKATKVAEIAAEFDPDAFRIIEVSARPRGQFVVLDGQHRIEALRKLGWDNGQMVECKVHRNITHERECALFDELNDQLKMAAIDRMLARIGAKIEPDVSIHEIVESVGLTISQQKLDGAICSARALVKVYTGARAARGGIKAAIVSADYHPDLLRSTLRVILAAWGKNREGLRGDLIAGMGAFLARHGDTVEIGPLVTRLAQIPGGPLGLLADGRALASLHNSQVESGIAGKLVFIYNERRRARRLPDWWSAQ